MLYAAAFGLHVTPKLQPASYGTNLNTSEHTPTAQSTDVIPEPGMLCKLRPSRPLYLWPVACTGQQLLQPAVQPSPAVHCRSQTTALPAGHLAIVSTSPRHRLQSEAEQLSMTGLDMLAMMLLLMHGDNNTVPCRAQRKSINAELTGRVICVAMQHVVLAVGSPVGHSGSLHH